MDGSSAEGTLALRSVPLKGKLGDFTIEVGRIRSITFAADGDRVETRASALRGRVELGAIQLETDLGKLTIERARLRSIQVLGPAPTAPTAPTAPPPAAPPRPPKGSDPLPPGGPAVPAAGWDTGCDGSSAPSTTS